MICSDREFPESAPTDLANHADTGGKSHSLVFDGMAFGYDAKTDTYVSRNPLLVEADDREGVFIAEPFVRSDRKDD